MVVYVVQKIWYTDQEIVGVYDSREKAEKAVKAQTSSREFDVLEMKVQ